MDLIEPGLEAWMEKELVPADDVEEAMRRVGQERDFPIIGPLVGQHVALLARMIGARRVFEMGSGFGYSTLWFARAVGEGGEVVHTDGDAGKSAEAKQWLDRAGVGDRVRFMVGDALEALGQETEPLDVVFIDVDKGDYPAAWRLARQHVRVGGLIVTDNTLWSGKVADPAVDDEWTQAVREYVRLAATDPDFESSIVPLRDGVCVSLRLR